MSDPTDLYRLSTELPEINEPVLLHHLDGFMDAGMAGRLAVRHLLETLDHRVVATFDVDRLIDYRARRPTMVFDRDHWAGYEAPDLTLRLVHDAVGTPFLLLSGLEPDREWERFASAVRSLVQRFEVGLTIGVQGIPMGVPHTRPMGQTTFSTRPDAATADASVFGRLEVPGSAAALMMMRLGELGQVAKGIAVHVPHYLSQTDYPEAAIKALEAVTKETGLALPLEKLREISVEANDEIDKQVAASEEISGAVQELERRYDEQATLAPEEGAMPSGDEIAAQFERFLAERDDPGFT